MGNPYLGEIRCFGFNFAPIGWAFCHGQLLPISQNDALFALIGTFYGGDGVTTFALPNLQSRVPMDWGTSPRSGTNYSIGQPVGVETVNLTIAQAPQHSHAVTAAVVDSGGVVDRTQTPNANSFLADSAPNALWNKTPTINVAFANNTVSSVGGSQPHENRQPFLALNFCIAMQGIFPSRN